MGSISRPRMDSVGPHMPASQRKAVPPGEDALVGGLRVGVGADDGGDAAIEEAANGDLLAGGLGVGIDENDRGLLAHAGDGAVEDEEGIIERGLHESAALDVDDADFALGGIEDDGALARDALRDN